MRPQFNRNQHTIGVIEFSDMELSVLNIQNKIYEIRGLKVMLDRDLATLYEVETRILNQAVQKY